MIRATITTSVADDEGGITDIVFELETDAAYSPDVADDLAARVIGAWHAMDVTDGGDTLDA